MKYIVKITTVACLSQMTINIYDVETFEMFQRKSLRQIQGLPDKTPKGITLALLGILPLETIIHKSALSLFMNISRNKHFLEYEIAERQLAMKDSGDKSWFNLIRQIQPCSQMWRICQCCSLKYFLPKIPKYHFVSVCDETYQKVHGHYNLHGESGVYFKIMRKMLFSLKPKDSFP